MDFVIKRILLCTLCGVLSVASVMGGTGDSVKGNSDGSVQTQTGTDVKKQNLRLGTNLLYDVATIANLTLEYGFKDHFAVEILCTFSPWNIGPKTRLRTLILQPDFKYYFKKGFTGHHIGLEAHLGWYNVSLSGTDRYQDIDGNTPAWGGGITYGYYLPISKNRKWGLDFNIGAGYARFDYDVFYNVHNGPKFDVGERDYWGITKLGITLFYNFNLGKGRKK